MNFREQLSEAYKAGFNQGLQELYAGAHEGAHEEDEGYDGHDGHACHEFHDRHSGHAGQRAGCAPRAPQAPGAFRPRVELLASANE